MKNYSNFMRLKMFDYKPNKVKIYNKYIKPDINLKLDEREKSCLLL